MDDRPIGVFDSGLGGLTTVRELCRLLPEEDIVYFGDTGRVPYGSRSRETIVKYARQDVAFLRTFDLKTIVIACGTVSTTALDVLAAENPIPVLGVVAPAARAAARATRSGRIGLIGTQASIRSGAYERLIRAENPAARVLAQPCPSLCPWWRTAASAPGTWSSRRWRRSTWPPEGGGGGHPGVGVHSLPPAGEGHRGLYGTGGAPHQLRAEGPGRRRTACGSGTPLAGPGRGAAAALSATGRRTSPAWPPPSWAGM